MFFNMLKPFAAEISKTTAMQAPDAIMISNIIQLVMISLINWKHYWKKLWMHSMIRLKLSGKLTKKSNQHSLKVFMLISGEQVLTKSEQNIPVKQKWPGQNIQTDLSEDSRRPPRRFESVQRNLQAASSSQRHILDISSSIQKSDKKSWQTVVYYARPHPVSAFWLHCHVLMRLFLYFRLSSPFCLVLDASKFMEDVCKPLCQVLIQFAFFFLIGAWS